MKPDRLISTVLIIAAVLFAQGLYQPQVVAAAKPKAEAKQAKTKKPKPRIEFEKLIHNFGKIGPGTKNECEFKFTNKGNALLKITRTDATCGCTIPKLEKTEYAPGESGTVKVTYNSQTIAGSTTKKLYVHTNDLSNSKVTLTLRGKIVVKVDYKPKRLKLSLKSEDANSPDIILTSLDKEPFSIKNVSSTAGCIKIDFDPSIKATRFVLKPKGDVKKLEKSLRGSINISLTHSQCNTVTIPFEALPVFKLNPRAFIIFNAQPQKPEVRKLWVLNNYNEEFEIESASSKNGIIKIVGRKKIGKGRYQFDLQIIPPAAEKNKKIFNDTFYIDIKGGKRLEVSCRGFYANK